MSQVVPLPPLLVEANGAPLAPEVTRALGEVRVQQRLSLPTLCELVFFDPPGPLTAGATLAPGAALRLTARGQSEPLFSGQVTAVEYVYEAAHGREVRVRGYDPLHRLRKRQTVRAHVQTTARDLARELVADLGLTVQAAEPGPLWPRLIQHRQTDLDLLVELAERCGLFLTLRGEVLHLLTLEGEGEPVPLALGRTLLEARLEVNGDPACRTVAAVGWDPLRVETHAGRAERARVGRVVTADAPPARVGGQEQRDLVDEGTPDASHAEALAQAELDRRLAREVTFWGVADGDTRLRPGARVEISGVEAALAGRYVLTAVTHTIDGRRGFVSELSSAPPPPAPRARGAVATPGVVTRVDDPDDLGRIQATLPTYGDVETDWMGVVCPAAGPGKGLVALPEVGDRVLVLLAHEDPGQGVVLGGLYGMAGAPDSGVEAGAVRRYTFQTPGGQRIQLDDAANAIRLTDRQGSTIELSPERLRVHAAVDLEIAAPGRAVVIRGQTIDFERA